MAAVRDFRDNVITFILAVPILILINHFTTPSYHWFWCVVDGWAAGLAVQTWGVLSPDGPLGVSWEERMIQKVMEENSRRGKDISTTQHRANLTEK